jgi:CBS domain-containing protein
MGERAMANTARKNKKSSVDVLNQLTAADLMTPNPVSIRGEASVTEAAVLFTDKAFSGAAVIDESGRPIGVLSASDLLVHDREESRFVGTALAEARAQTADREYRDFNYQVVDVDRATVNSVMTPVVFSVTPENSARRVMNDMVSLHVHRLFVVDQSGVLVGVISALDVIKGLLKATEDE